MFTIGLPAEIEQPVFWKWSLARYVLDCRHTVRGHACSSSSTVDSSLALEDCLIHLLLTECGMSCL